MTYNEQKIQEEFRKMKATGIVRRIDDLGRVVIPKEIRKTLRIKEGTPLEIFTDREGQIILKKYSPIGELNTFAAEYAEALVQTTGLTACITDRDQVVAACGSGSRELEGKEISSDLDAVIAGRKGRMVSQDSRENISVISDAMDSFCQKMIQPILCASDAIGAVILLTKSEKTALGDTERALIRTGPTVWNSSEPPHFHGAKKSPTANRSISVWELLRSLRSAPLYPRILTICWKTGAIPFST